MKRTCLIFLILILGATGPAWAQKKKKEPKNKFGAIHYTHTGAQYTLSSATSTSTASDDLVGAGFFYERLFLSRFSAGFKWSSFLERSTTHSLDSNTVTVLEKTSMTTFDFKAFFKDHMQNGMKPFLGVSFGTYAPKSTITTIATAGNTEGSTAASVPITGLSFGFDYILDFGGVRVEGFSITGKRRDLTGHDTYIANYRYDGSALSVGVYSFF